MNWPKLSHQTITAYLFEHISMSALSTRNHRREYHDFCVLAEASNCIADLFQSLRNQNMTALGATDLPDFGHQ